MVATVRALIRPVAWAPSGREQWADENPQAERERLREERPKPAWYEQAMAHAVQKQGRTA